MAMTSRCHAVNSCCTVEIAVATKQHAVQQPPEIIGKGSVGGETVKKIPSPFFSQCQSEIIASGRSPTASHVPRQYLSPGFQLIASAVNRRQYQSKTWLALIYLILPASRVVYRSQDGAHGKYRERRRRSGNAPLLRYVQGSAARSATPCRLPSQMAESGAVYTARPQSAEDSKETPSCTSGRRVSLPPQIKLVSASRPPAQQPSCGMGRGR